MARRSPSGAARGALEPLDDLINKAGIKQDDYWAPSWNQTLYEGKIWSLTYGSDPNFGFFWNKNVFKDAGLDPEKPPTTVAEMDQFAEKIAKVDGNRIERLGLHPLDRLRCLELVVHLGLVLRWRVLRSRCQKDLCQ